MSLTGIRDLTLLHTPPADRQPILTYVGEYDERAVAEAIRRELLREGQVFFVHNRVADIEKVAAELRALVPEARRGRGPRADGRGHPREGRARLLGGRSTTCWSAPPSSSRASTCRRSTPWSSTGPTGSGLGQLHQLRGRVGRAGQRAYAYLLFPPDQALSEEAYERLRTIGEHTELGSGFKIAMRDLEIRGAGNLLGGDQSGHIAAVGYDLYVQMVTEAVAELKGEELRAAGRDQARPAADGQPARRLRVPGGPPARGLPPPGDGDHPRRGRRHRVRVARPLRPAAGPRPPALLRIGHLRAECARLGHARGGGGHGRGRPVGGRLHRPAARRSSSRPASGSASPAWSPRRSSRRTLGQLVIPLPRGADPGRRPGRLACPTGCRR